MKNRALTLAARGITVNSLSPGGVVTPANRHILDSEELYAAVKAETLLGKWAAPEEIAEFAYFMTVVNRSQAIRLQLFVRATDPHSFITITSSSEIVGKGFRAMSE